MVSNNFPKGTEVDLKIPMLPDMELAAAKTAEAMAEYAHFSEDEIEEIKMALIEACINAFEHSDSMDRNVYITFHVEKEKMVVQIRDKGKGFDKKGVETPDIAKKIHAEYKRGWGMQLIESLMDEVDVQSGEDGTVVSLTKFI